MVGIKYRSALHLRRLERIADLPKKPKGRLQWYWPQRAYPLHDRPQHYRSAVGNNGYHLRGKEEINKKSQHQFPFYLIPSEGRIIRQVAAGHRFQMDLLRRRSPQLRT